MKNATAELTRWADDQTAITEREAHRSLQNQNE